jgi:hypothetical protein
MPGASLSIAATVRWPNRYETCSKLLEEGQSDDLRIGEVFEGFVAVRSPKVEGGVGVVYEAEEHGQSFFQVVEGEGMLRWAI